MLHLRVGAASALVVALVSCAGAAGSTRVEDKARRDVPIAICRKALAVGDLDAMETPRAEAYWSVLLPSFRSFDAVVDAPAVDCVGDPIVATNGASRDGTVAQAVLHASPTDFTVAPAADGMQTVWLRMSNPSDRVASGPLALVRPRPAELDVYGIGPYRGSARNSRFEFTRMGRVMVVTAKDDACADVKVETECESTIIFYILVGGQLLPAAKTPSRRIQHATMKAIGRVQSRLTTESPVFDDHSVHVREKLSVRDSSDDEVRKSEGERVFTLRGTDLVANGESISSQVMDHP